MGGFEPYPRKCKQCAHWAHHAASGADQVGACLVPVPIWAANGAEKLCRVHADNGQATHCAAFKEKA